MTLEEIETIEAHGNSLLELARKQREKLEKKEKRKPGLSAEQIAALDRQREKTISRRNHKNPNR